MYISARFLYCTDLVIGFRAPLPHGDLCDSSGQYPEHTGNNSQDPSEGWVDHGVFVGPTLHGKFSSSETSIKSSLSPLQVQSFKTAAFSCSTSLTISLLVVEGGLSQDPEHLPAMHVG